MRAKRKIYEQISNNRQIDWIKLNNTVQDIIQEIPGSEEKDIDVYIDDRASRDPNISTMNVVYKFPTTGDAELDEFGDEDYSFKCTISYSPETDTVEVNYYGDKFELKSADELAMWIFDSI